jgi:4-amino-4-deoxy-L-arabinose transferase-like glycosyltransferase
MYKYWNNIIYPLLEKGYYIFLAVILSAALFNIFFNLGNTPINSWDEARHGVSSYEMLRNNNLIVNTYAYQNDYWNLKPPLSFWAISLGYAIAGFNPLGLRLFSGIAALMTIVIVTVFTKHSFGKFASIISASVLATTPQYILSHSARSGDADSLHVLFFTLAIVSSALINKNVKWLYVAGLAFSLSFLTKSWHSLGILAIIGLYLIISRTVLKIKAGQWIICGLISFIPIFSWAVLRFSNDGFTFFSKMISFDLLARSSNALEGHIGAPSYYLQTLTYHNFIWLLVLAGSFTLFLFTARPENDSNKRNTALLLVLWVSIPLLLYSAAKTKITWYILPIFPALAISTGALCSYIVKNTREFILLHLIIASILVYSLYKNEKYIGTQILSVHQDNVQLTLEKLKDLKGYRNAKIYTECGDSSYPTCWRQCDFLAAELYGDLRPQDGGLISYLKDDSNALLMLPKDNIHMSMAKSTDYKILIEDSTNCIITRLKQLQ